MDYLEELKEFLRIDTTSAKGRGVEGAKWLRDKIKELGAEAKLIGGYGNNPYVIADIDVGAKNTITIYNHYDIQPVEPLDKWHTDPFEPVIKGDRIYSRGVADDKGALMARLQGIRDLMREGKLKVNLRLFYEGEEEIGSPHMESFLKDHAEEVSSRFVLWEGAGRTSTGEPTIVLGVKGLLYVELVARTEKDLHSMYAPIVRNPAWEIVKVLNRLRDEEGRVKLPGFYDKVRRLDQRQRSEVMKANKEEMEKALGQSLKDGFQVSLFEEPTCNIAGINAGYTGEGSKTVIPSLAFVKLDFRLVPDQTPQDVLKSLEEFLKGSKIEIKVYGMVDPYRTSPENVVVKAIANSAERVYGTKPVILPNSPGTGPMALVARYLKVEGIADGIAPDRPDSNIHSFNESVKVEDYYLAINHMKEFLRSMEVS